MNGTIDKALALRKVSLFGGLQFEELAALGRIAQIREVPAGSLIFRQGEPGETLYVVLSGQVEIIREADQKEISVAKIGPSGYFGEFAILTNQPRTATARIIEHAVMLQIHKHHFRELLITHSSLTFEILRTMAERMSMDVRKAEER